MTRGNLPDRYQTVKGRIRKNRVVRLETSISIYEGAGVMMSARGKAGNPTGKGGGRRGVVTTWSTASRRRMRYYLLTHRPIEGHESWGVTLTVPGVPDIPRAKSTYDCFARLMSKAGWGAVWRVEVQRRGALHWHLLASLPASETWRSIEDLWLRCLRESHCGWYELDPNSKALSSFLKGVNEGRWIEGEHYEVEGDPADPEHWVSWDVIGPWAVRHACQGEKGGVNGAWMRYLQDHATKVKQHQLADGIGRHWGVIGRKAFRQVLPDEVCELDPREYYRVVRWARRMATPYVREPGALFGRRRGYTPRRGLFGNSVWFSRPETLRRMIEKARSLSE